MKKPRIRVRWIWREQVLAEEPARMLERELARTGAQKIAKQAEKSLTRSREAAKIEGKHWINAFVVNEEPSRLRGFA